MTNELPSIYAEALGLDISFPDTFKEIKEAEQTLIERAEKAEKQLEALNERTRWIPISEELPNLYEDVLIFSPTRWTIEIGQCGESNHWFAWLGTRRFPTHWMLLPLPPNE